MIISRSHLFIEPKGIEEGVVELHAMPSKDKGKDEVKLRRRRKQEDLRRRIKEAELTITGKPWQIRNVVKGCYHKILFMSSVLIPVNRNKEIYFTIQCVMER